MQESFQIRKVAVLGAGVMGAQIAAHCANAGIETVLFDLAAKSSNKNQIVIDALARLKKLKPSPIAGVEILDRILPANYETGLSLLSECDLVIEAIAERMDFKKDLYHKISSALSKNAILASNTSGLGINDLMAILPGHLQSRFCGIHFFNPPRYMHLAELIPAEKTDATLLDELETWLCSYLGKGVVRAKDTPNFIANRIGVFSMLAVVHHAEKFGLSPDEVDALTGTLLGRPKSATMRTMDVVGLDTMKHVIETMNTQLEDDPWHALFKMPKWLDELVAKGHLGQKTGQGIYRKAGKQIEVFDVKKGEYRPVSAEVSKEVQQIMQLSDPHEKMKQLLASIDKQAQFLAACFIDLYHYCAYHLKSIADCVRDVDLAIRWGFGWQQGPFESWQLSGKAQCQSAIEAAINTGHALAPAALPQWLSETELFYKADKAYAPEQEQMIGRSSLPVYEKQLIPLVMAGETSFKKDVLYQNEGVCLWHLQDGVAVISLKSKANTFGQAVLEGMNEAISIAEQQSKAIILYQDNPLNFSSGANLKEVYHLITENKLEAVSEMLEAFQNLSQRIRYTALPVVAALRGRALGGGCEILLHCDAVVAAFESYPGLVEMGVGLIPGGGGCKEMARRAMLQARHTDLADYIELYFKHIATAKVSSNALEAIDDGYLSATDTVVMHTEEVLYAALQKANFLLATNYSAPLKQKIKIAGIETKAKIQTGLVNWLEGGFISRHDYDIALELAGILCGGDLNQGAMVDEDWLLKLERDAFIRLCKSEKTRERIAYMLEKNKPLRN